jgi:hypothetical protein
MILMEGLAVFIISNSIFRKSEMNLKESFDITEGSVYLTV